MRGSGRHKGSLQERSACRPHPVLHHGGEETPAPKAQSNGTPPPALQYKLQIKALDQICSRVPRSIYDELLISLDELQPSQTCVTVLADDDVHVWGTGEHR